MAARKISCFLYSQHMGGTLQVHAVFGRTVLVLGGISKGTTRARKVRV
jgi:hypothetical protein